METELNQVKNKAGLVKDGGSVEDLTKELLTPVRADYVQADYNYYGFLNYELQLNDYEHDHFNNHFNLINTSVVETVTKNYNVWAPKYLEYVALYNTNVKVLNSFCGEVVEKNDTINRFIILKLSNDTKYNDFVEKLNAAAKIISPLAQIEWPDLHPFGPFSGQHGLSNSLNLMMKESEDVKVIFESAAPNDYVINIVEKLNKLLSKENTMSELNLKDGTITDTIKAVIADEMKNYVKNSDFQNSVDFVNGFIGTFNSYLSNNFVPLEKYYSEFLSSAYDPFVDSFGSNVVNTNPGYKKINDVQNNLVSVINLYNSMLDNYASNNGIINENLKKTSEVMHQIASKFGISIDLNPDSFLLSTDVSSVKMTPYTTTTLSEYSFDPATYKRNYTPTYKPQSIQFEAK